LIFGENQYTFIPAFKLLGYIAMIWSTRNNKPLKELRSMLLIALPRIRNAFAARYNDLMQCNKA